MPGGACRWAITVLAALLVACGGAASRAPVKEQAVSRRAPEAPTREVRAGDTLYSIAWESGRDYHDVAEWNGIKPPYLIRPGQVLRLYPPKSVSSPPARPAAPARTGTAAPDKPRETDARAAKPAPAKFAWAWPTDGKLIERFTPGGARGIAIAGKRGQPVYATAPGTVVYQGSGLRGYGQLIILKHSDEFLSAYAHNDKMLVKEGDAVKRGQKIAEMGSTGTDQVKLHFEIRHHGVPVDPLKYLPK